MTTTYHYPAMTPDQAEAELTAAPHNMKAITLTQPWATLVAIGAKKIETRSWRTEYRGPLAIHAAKGFPKVAREMCEMETFRRTLWDRPGLLLPLPEETADHEMYPPLVADYLPLGCVVAVCDLVAVHSTNERLTVTKATQRPIYSGSRSDSERPPTEMKTALLLPPNEPELSFGDYSPGRFAWVLENVRPLTEPVPARGALGLWEWERPDLILGGTE